MKTKMCTNCKTEKTLDRFNKGTGKLGLNSWCRKCKNKLKKEYEKSHKKEIKRYSKQYYNTHKNQIKKYQQEHKEKRRINERKRYKTNQKVRIKKFKYIKNRRKTNISYKLMCYLRTRTYQALRGICKSQRTTKLIGCSIEFLKGYLQAQFRQGMTWQNYGKWHVDHIKPCASFDLSQAEEQAKCFNYKNLQPLWAIDNLIKGGKNE
jgi:hypothetical protein